MIERSPASTGHFHAELGGLSPHAMVLPVASDDHLFLRMLEHEWLEAGHDFGRLSGVTSDPIRFIGLGYLQLSEKGPTCCRHSVARCTSMGSRLGCFA